MNLRLTQTAAIAVLLTAQLATAQMGRGPMGGAMGGPPRPPAFLRQVFPPRMVMEHQRELELRPEQIEAIKKAMNDTQAQLNDLQWQLDAESESLNKMLGPTQVDEPGVLVQLDRVTAIESQLKKANFTLLVRIKNQLDAEQQRKLRQLPQPFGRRGGPEAAAE